MKHTDALQHIMHALDGPLAPEVRAALDAHLETCAACRAEAEALSRVDRLFAAKPARRAPRGFAARTTARLTDPALAGGWQAQFARTREDWLRAFVGLGILMLGGSGAALVMILPFFGTAGMFVRALFAPEQWPMLWGMVSGWLHTLSVIARFLLVMLNMFNGFFIQQPVLVVALFAGVGIVAVWAWVVKSLTEGRPPVHVMMVF